MNDMSKIPPEQTGGKPPKPQPTPPKFTRAPKPPPLVGRPYYKPQLFQKPGEYPFPAHFPQDQQAKIKLVEIEAVAIKKPVDGIRHMMLPFIAGARELGMRGLWSVDQVDREILDFLRHSAICQYLTRGPYSEPNDEVKATLQSLPEYRSALRDVAEAQIARATKAIRKRSMRKRPQSETPEERCKRRWAVVEPRLRKKGWKPSDWGNTAGVSDTVVYRYLKGTTDPIPENRAAMAEALGLKANELPI